MLYMFPMHHVTFRTTISRQTVDFLDSPTHFRGQLQQKLTLYVLLYCEANYAQHETGIFNRYIRFNYVALIYLKSFRLVLMKCLL